MWEQTNEREIFQIFRVLVAPPDSFEVRDTTELIPTIGRTCRSGRGTVYQRDANFEGEKRREFIFSSFVVALFGGGGRANMRMTYMTTKECS